MKSIAGAAAFGLGDRIARTGGECTGSGFFLADAVLPRTPLGTIRTGTEAEEERIHAGLGWPKEARILPGEPLRRAPVPCVWSLLVEAGDTPARWASASGGSFPLAAILAEHVITLLEETGNGRSEPDEVVLAIPDHLEEYGQEALLQELRHRGGSEARLLWRPVAAALAWLDKVQDGLGKVEPDDWMAVLYLGADGIEYTGFRLRPRKREGRRFVLPIRERPAESPGPSGADWVVDTMAELLGLDGEDPGAFWQVFTAFPEVWEALAGRPWDLAALPRAWSKGGGWEEWAPPPSLVEEAAEVSLAGGKALWQLLGTSCSHRRATRSGRGNQWGEYLVQEASRLLKRMPGGRLRGVVICGPLAPSQATPPAWAAPFDLSATDAPVPDKIWLVAGDEDPVAAGARIYGERLAMGLPTYLDTLPQISTLAIANCEYSWVNLVESTTCEGGMPYTNSVKGHFQLQKECDWVEVYLQRGERTEAPPPEETVPTLGLPSEWVEGVQNSVRSFESLEAVREHDGWNRHQQLKEYALAFAEAHFAYAEQERAPYRRGKMRFPSAPEEDTVIDLMVKMRPASGLAQVEFLPRESAFLRGRRVFFDYSRMEDAHELPELKRGWPETLKMQVTRDSSALSNQKALEAFLACTEHNISYEQLLDDAKKCWTAPVPELEGFQWVYLKKLDQDGQAGSEEGQAVVDKLRQKVAKDFAILKTGGRYPRLIEKVVIRGTWLWGGTPHKVIEHLEEYLEQRFTHYPAQWRYFIEAASRCFTEEHQLGLLFASIHTRLQRPGTVKPFPIESARSIYRVLMYRRNAPFALTDEHAHTFLDESLHMINLEVSDCKIKKLFFQGVLLFFVLLRYRKKDQEFMNPDLPRYLGIFEHVEDMLERAKQCVRRQGPNNVERIVNLLNDIMAYVRFEGVPGIIELVVKETEETGDDSES